MSIYSAQLRPASFRGVPFFVETHDLETGKRVKQHEFSGRDEPYTESLGRKGARYNIAGVLIGDDVFFKRDALRKAFERDGAGTLVHPFLGVLDVECGLASFSESILEGRKTRFSVEFFEKGTAVNPGSALDKIGRFFTKINDSIASIQEDFTAISDLASTPQYVLNSAIDLVGSAKNTFISVFGRIANPSEYISSIKRDVLRFADEFEDLLYTPAEFAESIVGIIRSIGGITNSHKTKQEIYNKIFDFDNDQPEYPQTTSTRSVQQKNIDLIKNLIKVTAHICAIRDFTAAVNFTFPDDEAALKDAENDVYYSLDDIEIRKKELLEVYNSLITSEINGNIYEELVAVSSLATEALPSPDDIDSSVKKVATIMPKSTTASLLLVYDFYESATNETDFINRNKIENPNFVAGGVELEVLSA